MTAPCSQLNIDQKIDIWLNKEIYPLMSSSMPPSVEKSERLIMLNNSRHLGLLSFLKFPKQPCANKILNSIIIIFKLSKIP